MYFKFLKRINKVIVIILLLGLIIPQFVFSKEKSKDVYRGKAPKYIFLFIGDGMALPQINSAEIFLAAGSNKTEIKTLNMSKMPAQGLTTTFSADSFITDSAAAATAIATGKKTDSGVISMDSSKKLRFKTLAEIFKDMGKKIGIVSSVSIDHATPACFYAHEPTRNNYYEIAVQMAKSDYDYFAGGAPKGNLAGKRKDRKDVMEIAKENGFLIINNKKDFMSLKSKNQKIMAFDKYLDSDQALYYELDRKNDSISLAEFTKKGIDLLDNPAGFFLMVEGGKIDWACHANDAASAIYDTLAFDDAIGEALKFYQKHPNETLIIVTGDHECGGMTIGFAGTEYSTYFDKIKYQKMSYIEFNKILVDYKKTHNENNAKLQDIASDIKNAFGIDVNASGDNPMGLTEYQKKIIEEAFMKSIKGETEKSKDEYTFLLYGGYEPLTVTITHVLNQKAGIGWTSYSHTGVPVPTFAIGNGHDLFNGYYDNTDIYNKVILITNASKMISQK